MIPCFQQIPTKEDVMNCTKPVKIYRKCGHVTNIQCWKAQQDNLKYTVIEENINVPSIIPNCNEMCNNLCVMGHLCKQICDGSGDCKHKCNVEITSYCPRKHEYRKKCSDSDSLCTVEVDHMLECGHKVVAKCYMDPKSIACQYNGIY